MSINSTYNIYDGTQWVEYNFKTIADVVDVQSQTSSTYLTSKQFVSGAILNKLLTPNVANAFVQLDANGKIPSGILDLSGYAQLAATNTFTSLNTFSGGIKVQSIQDMDGNAYISITPDAANYVDTITLDGTEYNVVTLDQVNTLLGNYQTKLTTAQLNAVNSGITSAKVTSYDNLVNLKGTAGSAEAGKFPIYKTDGNLTVASTPSADNDAASKSYVDMMAGYGVNILEACRVATTGNITLSGLQTIDGVTLVANDRVLVKNQTNASTNGVYVAKTGAWTRALDANDTGELSGALVAIEEGSTNKDTVWYQQNDLTALTDAQSWVKFLNVTTVYNAGNGLQLSGNTFSIKSKGVTNDMLANNAITIAGTSVSLGGSITLDTILGLSQTGFVRRTGANTYTVTETVITGDLVDVTENSLVLSGPGDNEISTSTGNGFVKVTNGVVSYDNSTYQKQLTAGDRINITNNTIKATANKVYTGSTAPTGMITGDVWISPIA